MTDDIKEICKNCKYHYIEEISFDNPQSCCNKTNPNHTTEEWLQCNDFEYSKDYITNLQEENERLKIEKQEEYNRFNLMAKFRDKALERTLIYKSRIDKAIYCINLNQGNSGSLSYENCKRVKGILKGDEFHLKIFKEQIKELKEGKK